MCPEQARSPLQFHVIIQKELESKCALCIEVLFVRPIRKSRILTGPSEQVK